MVDYVSEVAIPAEEEAKAEALEAEHRQLLRIAADQKAALKALLEEKRDLEEEMTLLRAAKNKAAKGYEAFTKVAGQFMGAYVDFKDMPVEFGVPEEAMVISVPLPFVRVVCQTYAEIDPSVEEAAQVPEGTVLSEDPWTVVRYDG